MKSDKISVKEIQIYLEHLGKPEFDIHEVDLLEERSDGITVFIPNCRDD